MQHLEVIQQLQRNAATFRTLLEGQSPAEYTWRPAPGKWCLLEIVCHLYDEEREDFRARVRHVLEKPTQPMTPIFPVNWVAERQYIEQDYDKMVQKFLQTRAESITWLHSLRQPAWNNVYQHPELGPLSAQLFLSNWLAHDYLHFRQINRLKYAYLETVLNTEPLDYAGNW